MTEKCGKITRENRRSDGICAKPAAKGGACTVRIERANAKINLYLNILSRRENGYHNIVSLMQTVSLCDLVSVDFRPSSHTSIRLQASGNDAMPTDCRNLAWRAAELFLGTVGRTGEVLISIEKHIPMAAGLAGGSTDAAAVLRALNLLTGSPLTQDELCALGARLGADIPFCILGGAALVTGIGEELAPMPNMPACHTVVACMGEGVSTPAAYRALDEKYGNFEISMPPDERIDRLCEGLKAGALSLVSDNLFNLFEEVVPLTHPCVDRLKAVMLQAGATHAMMSGSGPSVFGIFKDAASAEAACQALLSEGAAAFVCHPRPQYREI